MILLVDTVSGRVVRHTSLNLCLPLLTSAYLCLPLLTSAYLCLRLSSPDCMLHQRLSSPDCMPHQVHSATHPGMRGPLNLLMGENWLVWHFWNPSQLSYQMAVIELFTNATFADDPLSLMIGGGPDYCTRSARTS
jgi:hypothetical protein